MVAAALALVMIAPLALAVLPTLVAAETGVAPLGGLARGALALALVAAALATAAAVTGGLGVGAALGLTISFGGFGLALLALQYAARALGIGAAPAQALALVPGLLSATTYFWIDPFLELARTRPDVRAALVRLAVDGNPALVAAGNFLQVDLLKQRAIYGQVCDLGPYYAYSYSPWGGVLAGNLAVAALLVVLGLAAAWVRRVRARGGAGTPPGARKER